MNTTVVQLRGGKGLTAAEQAFLAGQIAEPTQAALDAYLRAPAIEGAAVGTAQIGDAITELGEATSAKIAEIDAAIVETEATRIATEQAGATAQEFVGRIQDQIDAKLPSVLITAISFVTLDVARAARIPGQYDAVDFVGCANIFDGGGARYLRVEGEPSHEAKFQSADGAWWEYQLEGGFARAAAFGDGRVGLLTAWSVSKRIICTPAATYAMLANDTLTATALAVQIVAGQSVFVLPEGGRLLDITGEWQNTQSVSAIDGQVLTLAAASGMAPGDRLKIGSEQPLTDYCGDGVTYGGLLGEFVQIASVDGNTVTLTKPLYYSYDTAVGCRVARIARDLSCQIAIGRVELPDGKSLGTAGIMVQAMLNPQIEIGQVPYLAGTAIRVLSCYGHEATIGNIGRGPGGTTGYGISEAGSEHGVSIVRLCGNIRHLNDSGAGNHTSNTAVVGMSTYGAAAYNTCRDSMAIGTTEAPFASHHGTRQKLYENVRAIGCAGTVSFRGVGNIARNCTFSDCLAGVSAFNQYGPAFATTDRTTFDNIVCINMRGSSLISANGSGTGSVLVLGGYYELGAGITSSQAITIANGSLTMRRSPVFMLSGSASNGVVRVDDNTSVLDLGDARFTLTQAVPPSSFITVPIGASTACRWQGLVIDTPAAIAKLVSGPAALTPGSALGGANIGSFTAIWGGLTNADAQAAQTGAIRNIAAQIEYLPPAAAGPKYLGTAAVVGDAGSAQGSAETLLVSSASGNTIQIKVRSDSFANIVAERYGASSNPSRFYGRKGRGTMAAPAIVASGDAVAEFRADAYVGASTIADVGYLRLSIGAAAPSPTDLQARYTLFLNPAASVTPAEVMRVEHSTGLSMFGTNPVIDANRHHVLRTYTRATLPTPTASNKGIAEVSNPETGKSAIVYNNGSSWRYPDAVSVTIA